MLKGITVDKKINFKEILKNSIPVIIFVAAMGILTLIFWPYIEELATDEGRVAFKAWIDSLGFGGWLVTLGIQLLQIFVAFIPGEPVEILLGYLWNPIGGMLTCLLGIFIGTLIIFLFVRKFGKKFVKKIVGTDDLSKYKFLSDKSKVEITIFILFFIPGTPKDVLTYVAPLAPISPIKYLVISTIARIPSIITSTLLGDRLAEGDWLLAVVIFAITALISLAGILIGNKYIEKKEKDHEKATVNK